MELFNLQVNHLTRPIGFRMTRTIFSWKVRDALGKKQAFARIRIANSEEALLTENEILYDTGNDENANSLAYNVDCELKPYTRYYWNVTVATDSGETETSKTEWFETGKMDDPWVGKWITCNSEIKRHPVFSKKIRINGEVKKARLFISGLGLYEAYYIPEEENHKLNTPFWEDRNYRIGNEYLTPYSNDYNEWIQYQTFDITKQLNKDGILSVILGNGWYKSRFGFTAFEDKGFYGNEWKLIAELRITYTDGREDIIGTDDSWSVSRSNIVFSNLYDGEHIDDTLLPSEEISIKCNPPKGVLTARMSLPVTIHETFVPAELIHTPAGEQVFDMGQEFAGLFTLKVHEPKGTVIHIQTGEILQQGNFYNTNLRSAKSEFIYTSDGTEKTLIPHFTYYGYRYVKVSGVSNLKKEDFTGLALYSQIEQRGGIVTGNDLVNKLISNVRWGMKCNFIDVPTDCPQRDERMGWTGDTQVFSPTATFLADTYAFYAKYLYDLSIEQKVLNGKVPDVVPSCGIETTACVWGDAACIIPWNIYSFYGDKSILVDQYESMKGWVDYIASVDGDEHKWRDVFHYGDWLALDNPNYTEDQVFGGTDEGFIANIYYAASAGIVADAAAVLGISADVEKYKKISNDQFEAVKYEYFSRSGRCCVKTQTAMLLTLKYHLSDNEKLIKDTLRKLFSDNNDKLKTGFVGTPLLGNVLTDNGFTDLAYKLLLNREYPGWLHEVELGATTIWERWNSVLDDGSMSDKGMNSLNHYSYGAIVEWIFRHVVGIEAKTVGFKKVIFHPNFSLELKKAEGVYDSPSGEYRLSWEIINDKKVLIKVKVPFDCEAVLELPGTNRKSESLMAGQYEFSYEI